MKQLGKTIMAFFLVAYATSVALGQAVDEKLLVGKWKFVKATMGSHDRDWKYNGDPLMTFDKNGRWKTEDSNPNYRQEGTWKIEGQNLVRDPDKTATRDVPPYPRLIKKLTPTEFVLAAPEASITFYFSRVN